MAKVPGIAAGPTLCFTSRLWVNEYTMCVLYDTLRCGSKCGGSQSAEGEHAAALRRLGADRRR